MGERPSMSEERKLIESLTDSEKEVLRVFLTRSEIKEVARVLGRSPAAVEQRLARARRKLGLRRSIDAAHMLARVEGTTLSGLPIYAYSDIADPPTIPSNLDLAEEGVGVIPPPFPTKGRPWNDSSVWVRVIAIALGTFVATASALLAASLLETIDRVVRQLL